MIIAARNNRDFFSKWNGVPQTPTLAILVQDGERVPMTIPSGGIVRVLALDHLDSDLPGVESDGKVMLMLAVDLRGRGELVSGAGG